MLKFNHKIGITIPAYNESDNILRLIKKIRQYLNCLIVIVDDSNNFKTRDLINKSKFKNIKYFHRKKKLGRGSAVFMGFKKIMLLKKISCLIEMDADSSHNPNELKRNLNYFFKNSLDLLIASRYLQKSKIINWPKSRKILSKLSNILARLLLGVPVNDYTNGYRFYSINAARTVTSKCNVSGGGFIILSEIILVLFTNNFKISEIKTVFKNRTRGESSVNLKLVMSSLIGLIKLYFAKINRN